jgi:AcrR family transcriptional regulator
MRVSARINDVEAIPLRERKKIRTREAIQKAALDLVRRHGYDSVTVEQIADRAEVSPATVFRYFSTKEDVFVQTQTEADIGQLLRARPVDEPVIQTLASVFAELVPVAEEDPGLLTRSQLIFQTPALLSRFRERRDETISSFAAVIAQHRDLPSDDMAVEIAVRAFFEAFFVATARWQAADGSPALKDVAADAFNALRQLEHAPTAKPVP